MFLGCTFTTCVASFLASTCSRIQNLALWVFSPQACPVTQIALASNIGSLGRLLFAAFPVPTEQLPGALMSLFLFYFFNTVNHFIPSTFWNNSLESTNSEEHLLVQESHGHPFTAFFHSLWSLKALQSHLLMKLGGNVSTQLVPADICCLGCLEPAPTAPRC